jgi:hypothetical protein
MGVGEGGGGGDGEGGKGSGMVRFHRVSDSALVPERYGVGERGERKWTVVGVNVTSPSGPRRAETERSEWESWASGKI